MLSRILILTALLALTGCLAQSRIQGKYIDQEADCRSEAKDKAANAQNDADANAIPGAPPAQVDTNFVLASAFSECMNKNGWKVSVPKTAAQQAAAAQAAAAAKAAGAPAASAPVPAVITPPQPAATNPAATPAAPILGPGVQPAPATAYSVPTGQPAIVTPVAPAPAAPAAPSYPQGSGASTYQPADPQEYGRGAGRQF